MALQGSTTDCSNGNSQTPPPSACANILNQLDDFIERINILRRSTVRLYVLSILLGPLSIGLSLYMMLHPSFYNVLESEDEFGYALTLFLPIAITLSCTWLVMGMGQYESTSSWNKRYEEYLQKKRNSKQKIAAKYCLQSNPQ